MKKLGIGFGLEFQSGGGLKIPPNTLLAGPGFFTLTGDTMTDAFAFGADQGTFSLSGSAVTFAQGTVPVLSAAMGTFTLTGNAATLTGANNIAASEGAFALTGEAVGFGMAMPAAQGSFVLTGEAATLTNGSGATAVVLDQVSTGFVAGNPTATWTHTPVGTPTAVVVCLTSNYFGTAITGPVTYGGVALTKLVGQISSGAGTNDVEIWGLANPPSGAQTVVISGGGGYTDAAALTFTGSSTTTCFRGSGVAATATSSALSVTVPSDPNDLVIDIAVAATASPSQSPTGTNVQKFALNSGSGYMTFGSVAPGSASVAMTWSLGSSLDWAQVGASIHAGP